MKKKLRIQELKIQSFITELDSTLAKTAKGGDDGSSVTDVTPIVGSGGSNPVQGLYNIYTSIAKPQSWFPYNGSSECTKITTTTTTTTSPKP